MSNPWAFGWTQLFTIIGFLITLGIATGGFRTFDRWKREKLEERKIEIAFDTLALAYESKFVFDGIRSPMSFDYEYKDMKKKDGESDVEWNRRGPYYAILKRIDLGHYSPQVLINFISTIKNIECDSLLCGTPLEVKIIIDFSTKMEAGSILSVDI